LLGGWNLRSHNKRLEESENDNAAAFAAATTVNTNLLAFQTEAEKRHAKVESTQQILARLHDRIDMLATRDEMKEVPEDIEKLLGNLGRRTVEKPRRWLGAGGISRCQIDGCRPCRQSVSA
jgi:hypothetical protein